MLPSSLSSRLTRKHVNMIKDNIVSSKRPFSGTDVYFRQAIRELRSEGWEIRYRFTQGSYVCSGKSMVKRTSDSLSFEMRSSYGLA